MSESTLTRTPEETAEIEKHKYFLSEKAGHDVGWQAAEEDWEAKFGEEFRRANNQEFGTEATEENGTFFSRLLAKARRR
jgi:hypothetical protein